MGIGQGVEIARSSGGLGEGSLSGGAEGGPAQWSEPGAKLGWSFPEWLVPRDCF